VLLSKVTTASAIEGDVQAVINAACEVWWGKGGIRLDPDPNIFTATLPPSGSGYDDTDLITGASIFSVSLPKELDLPGEILAPSPITNQYVEVYLVDKLADSRGGGIAHRCASSDAYVILEISQLVHNHFLLAHELGHVFGLRHPEQTVGGGPCNDSSLPYGSTCAVMVPDRPNSPRLTTNDLAGIDAYNPDLGNAYDLLGFAGQRDTNAGANFFQIVRDFPYDDGSSPSQLRPPFSNWTSRSDIWNAAIRPYQGDVHHFYGLSNSNLFQKGDPFFAPGHFPYHHQPTYSGPNYMYVRIHTCQPLATVGANVQAHIFLAYPGVSLDSLIKLVPDGTSNPLPFVDTPQNDYQPRMGGPTVRFTKWIVPDTVPVHCCAFAVVTSINDPADTTAPPSGGLQDVINHPENHNFYSLWDRLKTDNDVAQRNYNVQGVPPGDASGALPPMPFANIFEDEATADLEIDATGADLENITLTVDGQEVAQIKGGQKERFRLHDALPPRQQLQLTMQANWQQGQPIGTAFPIGLGFYLGDKLVYDYEHLIQVVSSKEASLQAMDMMVGALRDVAAAWKLLEARKLVADVRQIVWRERGVPAGCLPLLIGWLNPPPKPWDEAFRQLGGRFRNLSQQLKEVDDTSAELVTVQQRMDTLIGLFEVTGMEMDTLMTGVREQAIFIQAIASQAARQAKMQSELQG
jgi:hypothetical protein